MKKLRTIFMGTPDFAVPCLELLKNHPDIELVNVVSMPDRPKGRGHKLQSPPVIDFCKNYKIPFLQTENINKEESFLETEVDLIIVLAFAQFLGSKVLSLPTKGAFNIHTSILPKYRGAAPIQYALLNNDESTGVSIQKMVKKMDAGDVAHFDELQLNKNETFPQLYTRLKFQAALSLNSFIDKLICSQVSYYTQDESKVTFAPSIKKEQGFLDFKNSTYSQLSAQVRALQPWPGTYCTFNGKRMKVLEVTESNQKLSPLEVSTSRGLCIGTKEGSLELIEVQLEGKKKCDARDLLNGLQGREVKINE